MLFATMKKDESVTKLLESEEGSVYLVRNNGQCEQSASRFASGKNFCCLMIMAFSLLTFLAMTYVMCQTFSGDHYMSKGRNSYHPSSVKTSFPYLPNGRPPYQEKARMARYIVHNSQWGVLTTFSTHMKGYPWGEVVSVSDGLVNNSTGIPLIYISTMDIAAHDLDITPQASFTFSEAQGSWCRANKIDPEDPRCSRVHLFGKIVKLTPDEIPAAKKAMFARHPVMADWPESHHFFFAKINLTRVEVLDYFGPISQVSIEDYLKAKP